MDKTIQIIILAFLLDCVIGDPQNPFHPIRLIGRLISLGIKVYKKTAIKSKVTSFIFGMCLSILTIAVTFFSTKMIIDLLSGVGYWFGFTAEVIICYFIISAKALKTESMKVYKYVQSVDLEKARFSLSYIVGRDTNNLTFLQIIKATIETVAENLSDGVIAPLIFVFIGGVPLGMAYKAINTLDSMVGYKNETYEYFGKFAARLDDVVNFIPARISALLMIISSLFTGGDIKMAFQIYIRDRYNHKSPNSAQTEAVCAGALGLCLGGDNYYKGILVHKPTIGDSIQKPSAEHIILANRMMYVTTVLAILIMLLLSNIF